MGDTVVGALKDVSIEFRENEFVSILGPSGCGKTTLLNIIGGLDKYTSGDLIINGKSTKEFQDKDLWMTKKETKALDAIVKNTSPALVRIWDSERQTEKEAFKRAGQAYKTYDELLKEKEEERQARASAKKQLDLGDKIHKPVEKTETVRETSVKEKEIEKEQKVQESPDLEK